MGRSCIMLEFKGKKIMVRSKSINTKILEGIDINKDCRHKGISGNLEFRTFLPSFVIVLMDYSIMLCSCISVGLWHSSREGGIRFTAIF